MKQFQENYYQIRTQDELPEEHSHFYQSNRFSMKLADASKRITKLNMMYRNLPQKTSAINPLNGKNIITNTSRAKSYLVYTAVINIY